MALSNAERQARWRQRLRAAAEAKGTLLPAAPRIETIPSTARWRGLADQARAALETARDEMQTYWDGRSDAWQGSERGEAMQEQLDTLERVLDDLGSLYA